MRLIVTAFFLTLAGCVGLGPIDTPAPGAVVSTAAAAQRAIDEGNAILIAINKTLAQQVRDGLLSPAEAQAYLDRSREAGRRLDALADLIAAGKAPQEEAIEVALAAIRALQREVHERIGRTR